MVWVAVASAWLCVGLVVALGIGAMGRTAQEVANQQTLEWLVKENEKLREHITRAEARAHLAQAAAGELQEVVRRYADVHGRLDGDRQVPDIAEAS
jgi:hypothetical protein